jgi:hypothetical protein
VRPARPRPLRTGPDLPCADVRKTHASFLSGVDHGGVYSSAQTQDVDPARVSQVRNVDKRMKRPKLSFSQECEFSMNLRSYEEDAEAHQPAAASAAVAVALAIGPAAPQVLPRRTSVTTAAATAPQPQFKGAAHRRPLPKREPRSVLEQRNSGRVADIVPQPRSWRGEHLWLLRDLRLVGLLHPVCVGCRPHSSAFSPFCWLHALRPRRG